MKMNKFNLLICLILNLFSNVILKSQTLLPLQNNPNIKYSYENIQNVELKSTLLNNDTLNLPFFDDFSYNSIFPNNRLWEDKRVFINNNYSIKPITYGVATFDAIDEYGNVYNYLSSYPAIADVLTSKPIDLSTLSEQDSLYLSFFYQCGGLGEKPEARDSLVLEFLKLPDNKWYRVWSTSSKSKTDTFYQAIIYVPGIFRKKGFKFRIANYVSISPEDFKGGQGAVSNGDMWHIDYVRLFKGTYEEHSKVYDISIINNLTESYIGFQSIPYSHINVAGYKNFRQTLPVTIRTNSRSPDLGEYVAVGLGYYFKDLKNNRFINEPYIEGIKNLKFDTIITFHDTLITLLQYDNTDYALVEIGTFLNNTPANDYKFNDTVKRIEFYGNYYAYDDGTPEYGFGISGEGTYGAMVACRFKTFVEDTLRAVDIYFNKTKNDYNSFLPFKVGVWTMGNDSLPQSLIDIEDQLYTYYPDSELQWLKFQRIYLKKPIFIKDYFFVGIIQMTEEFINIGYDVNTNSKNNIFYNITGQWQTLGSSFKNGSLMIRPVFSKTPLTALKDLNYIKNKSFIYPNPAKDYFKLKLNENDYLYIEIYDLRGTLIKIFTNESEIFYVNDIPNGIYIIKVVSGNKVFQDRLIISK